MLSALSPHLFAWQEIKSQLLVNLFFSPPWNHTRITGFHCPNCFGKRPILGPWMGVDFIPVVSSVGANCWHSGGQDSGEQSRSLLCASLEFSWRSYQCPPWVQHTNGVLRAAIPRTRSNLSLGQALSQLGFPPKQSCDQHFYVSSILRVTVGNRGTPDNGESKAEKEEKPIWGWVLQVNALGNRALICTKPSEQHSKHFPGLSAQKTGGGKINIYIRYCPPFVQGCCISLPGFS